MPHEIGQAGVFLIDDHVFADDRGLLPDFKTFVTDVSAKLEAPLFGILLTLNLEYAQSNMNYYQDLLGQNIKLVSALGLPPRSGPRRDKAWVNNFSVGLAELLACMPVRKAVGIGVWSYIESVKLYGQPVELTYWILLFAGFNPLFMRRVVYFLGSFLECPSHPNASNIVVRKGKDYRDILLMSLTAIHLGVAHSPYKIARAIEESFKSGKFGSADSLRKTISGILQVAKGCCLVNSEGNPPVYTMTDFGTLLLDALLSNHLLRYVTPSKVADFIERILAREST